MNDDLFVFAINHVFVCGLAWEILGAGDYVKNFDAIPKYTCLRELASFGAIVQNKVLCETWQGTSDKRNGQNCLFHHGISRETLIVWSGRGSATLSVPIAPFLKIYLG